MLRPISWACKLALESSCPQSARLLAPGAHAVNSRPAYSFHCLGPHSFLPYTSAQALRPHVSTHTPTQALRPHVLCPAHDLALCFCVFLPCRLRRRLSTPRIWLHSQGLKARFCNLQPQNPTSAIYLRHSRSLSPLGSAISRRRSCCKLQACTVRACFPDRLAFLIFLHTLHSFRAQALGTGLAAATFWHLCAVASFWRC